MKILVLGTIDNKGGAAQISWELRKRLKADSHTVSTFVRYKYSHESDVYVIPRKHYQDWLVKLFANDLMFAKTKYLFNTKEYKEADIIHCHNLHSNFFNLRDLIRMSHEKPVIWTLHDIWAFTGFASNSITLKNPNKKRFLLYLWDNTSHLLALKKKIYDRSKLTVITVSDWLKKETERSVLGNQKILRIYNGIDIHTFIPGNKIEARKKLGLPLDKKIVGCGIKGWMDSQKIIDSYKNREDVFFVALGHTTIVTENKNFMSLPRTEDRKILAQYLQSLDIFIHPTPEDSFGLISTEALSCGIPVVTYNIDALPETILHKKVGYVASYQNTEDLKQGIEYILSLSKEEYENMSTAARKRIEQNFNSEVMYKQYLELYKQTLSEKSTSSHELQKIN